MTMRNPEQTIGNLIDKQSITYLSSVDEDGYPQTKAMLAPRKREGIAVFYLTTNTSAKATERFKKTSKACLYFCNRRFFRGVTLTGNVRVLTDQQSKDMLWEPGDERYYPQGPADPDYCVLQFTAHTGRYYSNFKKEDFSIALPVNLEKQLKEK